MHSLLGDIFSFLRYIKTCSGCFITDDTCLLGFLLSPLAVKPDSCNSFCKVYRCACMCSSGFVHAITSTFMHGFQNSLEQLLSLRRRSAN